MKKHVLIVTALASLGLANSAALAQESSLDQAIAVCAQAMLADPAAAGAALETSGFAKTAGADMTTYAKDGVTVVMGPGKQCTVSDAVQGSAALGDKVLAMVGTVPEDKDDAGCRRLDMGSGVKVSVTGGDSATCESDTDGTLRFVGAAN